MTTERRLGGSVTGEGILRFLVLTCLFMAILNVINRHYYFIYIAAGLFLIAPGRRLRVNGSLIALLVFSVSVVLFTPSASTMVTNAIKPFTYPLCYLIGYSLFHYESSETEGYLQEEKNTSLIVYVVAGGSGLHFLLNMITNWESTERDGVDFWTKDVMSATGQAVLACIAIGVAVAFLFSKVSKQKKLIAIVTTVVILAYNLTLAGRTIFVLFAITGVLAFLCVSLLTNRRKLPIRLLSFAAVILVIVVLYEADFLGVKTAVESSNFYYRFFGNKYSQDVEQDSRMTHKMAYLKYFLQYPWGGSNIKRIYGHHAHDLYLDAYDESGIFALCAIVVYIVCSIIRVFKCLRNKQLTVPTRLLLFCVCLTCNIQFFLEPITSGVPWLLAAYCLIDGAMTYLLKAPRKSALTR